MASSGLSLPQLTTTSCAFADVTGNIGDNAALAIAFQNVTIINMANADYTMSDVEAATVVKILTNVGDGTKTLTWPSTADGLLSANQFIYMGGASHQVTLAAQSGGATAIAYPAKSTEIYFAVGYGIFSMADFYASFCSGVINGVNNVGDSDYVVTDDDYGKLIYIGGAGAHNLTINTSIADMPPNAYFRVMQAGAGAVTINGTATIVGLTGTTAQNDIIQITRDGTTDNWYVGR